MEWDGGGIEKVFLWGFALLCKVGYFGGKMGGVGLVLFGHKKPPARKGKESWPGVETNQ